MLHVAMAAPSPSPSSPSLEKKPSLPTAADAHDAPLSAPPISVLGKLPDEIIAHILHVADPNSFASLVVLNSTWRRAARARLYAHQLSKCKSYSASHGPPTAENDDDDLPRLRRLFAQETKRNLFDVYMRPATTTVKLVSNSISSSSAPGGEGMQFSSSPRGHHLLAFNSSRIYVIDARSSHLHVARELKVFRRPCNTCILDNGSLLAVLGSMQVDIFDLTQSPPRRKQCLILDHAPRAIALSPCGNVLAAAYEGGIEVSAVTSSALPTDRRAVKCDAVDSLSFSLDGTQLLGTTNHSHAPNTVILTAPYYDPGSHIAENNPSAMWTTSILFPNTSRDCSHAVLLQESGSIEADWAFTYDRSFETFRAVRIDDLRNGTSYFTGPTPTTTSPGTLLPCTLPAANFTGELVCAGFEGKDIWLYGVPEDLDAVPAAHPSPPESAGGPGLSRMNSSRSTSLPPENSRGRVPQWQILCDKHRNTFLGGRKIAELDGITFAKWVSGFGDRQLQERLVVAARGVLPGKIIPEEDDIDFVDGGRITLLDFDHRLSNGEHRDITIEVGTKAPEVLEEEHRDLDTEVAIVRRRTVAQRGSRSGMRFSNVPAPSAESLLQNPVPPLPSQDEEEDPLIPRRMRTARDVPDIENQEQDLASEATLEEVQEALDAPYAHATPRSVTTLRRAATAAAVNRSRQPQRPVAGEVQYRRADGRAEHPHESDADNWVPPPPPYTKEDPGDLPAFLRHTAVTPETLAQAVQSVAQQSQPPVPPLPPVARAAAARPATSYVPNAPPTTVDSALPPLPPIPSQSRPQLPRIRTVSSQEPSRRPPSSWSLRAPQPRMTSDPEDMNRVESSGQTYHSGRRSISSSSGGTAQHQQAVTSHVAPDDEDIYDVSPIEPPTRATRPQVSVQTSHHPAHQQPSSGSQSASTGYTPSSSASYYTTGSSQHSASAGPTRHSVFAVATPSTRSAVLPPTPETSAAVPEPRVRRLSNARTWPRQPAASQEPPSNGHPYSAPVIPQGNHDSATASMPPLPSADQMTRLNNRQSTHNVPPRRASGLFQAPRVPSETQLPNRVSQRHSIATMSQMPQLPEPDQPLIISTPTGVQGAFDASQSSTTLPIQPPEPILHAPVPRHPRTMPAAIRPPPERLNTIYSSHDNTPPSNETGGLTFSSLRHHASVSRRHSRAHRGAVKNMLDARGRGWTGRAKKDKKKEENNDEVNSPGGWTDITHASANPPRSSGKGKKCVIM